MIWSEFTYNEQDLHALSHPLSRIAAVIPYPTDVGILKVAQTNARELYLRPITPQQLLARFSREELAVKVSRGDLEVKLFKLCPRMVVVRLVG